jgi:repressor LexA
MSLTGRQRQVLDEVTRSVEERGYPPSLRELAAKLKVAGTRAIEKHLAALEKKGRLRRGVGARALELLDRARGRLVPIVGRVAAGRPILAEENLEGTLTLDDSVARWKDSFLLKVKGASMKDAGILDGDLVLVKPQPDAESGEIVVAMLDGEATVKRLSKKGKSVALMPENPDFKPIWVDPNERFELVGKVVCVIRF